MSLPSYVNELDLTNVDLADHHSLTRGIISLNVAFMMLVILVTAIRMSIRLFMVKAAGFDDWLMVLATIFTILICTFSLLGAHFGLGTHIWLLSPTLPTFLHKITRITQSLYGCYLSYATSITLVKLSLIVSYLRIFPSRDFRRLVISTGFLVVLMWLCSVFVIVFECVPVAAAWNWTVKGKCINLLSFFYVSSSVNIATDIVLWFSPLPIFWGLTMGTRERVMICGVFGFGFFACIASILRLSQLHGLHSTDITYTSVPSLNWSVAEVSTAIICACIPSMRPLFTKLLHRSLATSVYCPRSNKTATSYQQKDGVELHVSGSSQQSLGRRREGSEEDRSWEGSRAEEGRIDRLEECVDLKEMLEESIQVVASPPLSPSGARAVCIDAKV